MLNLRNTAAAAIVFVCASLLAPQAGATDVKTDVDNVVKAVRQAYPNMRYLCSGSTDGITNAVKEAITSLGKTIRNDVKTVTAESVKRIQSGCPY